jgi:hypothetical protein
MKLLCICSAAALLFSTDPQSVRNSELGVPHVVDVNPELEGDAQIEISAHRDELLQTTTSKHQINHPRTFPRDSSLKLKSSERSRNTKEQCDLPTALALKRLPGSSLTALKTLDVQPENTAVSVQKILQSLAARTKVTATPFLWLHWGESDFMCLAGRKTAHNVEKTDYHSKCVYDGLKMALLGDDDTQDATIIQALGAFFLCKDTHRQLYDGMQNFILSNSEMGHPPTFQFYDSFYLPVGNESSAVTRSWVVAAKRGKRPVVLVGPDHLASLHCMLNYVKHFRIPLPTQGCQDVDPLVKGILELSEGTYSDESVLFVVAGAAVGKIVAYEAFKKLQHKDVFVDVGSSLDAYAGVRSRDYNRDLGKFCQESKGWMAYDVCQRECQDVHPDQPCQQCEAA